MSRRPGKANLRIVVVALLGFIDEFLVVLVVIGGALYVLVRLQVINVVEAVLISIPLIAASTIALAKIIESMKREKRVGIEALIGLTGRVASRGPGGSMYVEIEGELWKAESVKGEVEEGDYVVVVGHRGLVLLVEKTEPPRIVEE